MEMSGEKSGYYEEMTADEFLEYFFTDEEGEFTNTMTAGFEEIFTVGELQKATVVRENGGMKIIFDSESDIIKSLGESFAGGTGLGDDVEIGDMELSITFDENGKFTGLEMLIDCKMTSEGVTMDVAVSLAERNVVYGDDSNITVPAPDGIADLPSYDDYLENSDLGF